MKPVKQDLLIYHDWLVQQNLNSEWLFPSTSRPKRHITEKQFYKVMAHVGDLLGINYLGTHIKDVTKKILSDIFFSVEFFMNSRIEIYVGF